MLLLLLLPKLPLLPKLLLRPLQRPSGRSSTFYSIADHNDSAHQAERPGVLAD